MSEREGSRFSWLLDEDEDNVVESPEEVHPSGGEAPRGPSLEARNAADTKPRAPVGVPGVAARSGRKRGRPADPNALRNDPKRMTAGARVTREVRRRVDQALADPAVTGEEEMNYSHLIEALLRRWLDEVGYGLK